MAVVISDTSPQLIYGPLAWFRFKATCNLSIEPGGVAPERSKKPANSRHYERRKTGLSSLVVTALAGSERPMQIGKSCHYKLVLSRVIDWLAFAYGTLLKRNR